MSTRTRLGVAAAQDLAGAFLHGVGHRWQHTIGVAARASELTPAVPPEDRELLVAAAWLHDIGYSPRLVATGFHPLDGAGFLVGEGWPPRLCALVANHSGARFVAAANGMSGRLSTYPDERSAVTDALALADQTTGPTGTRVSIEARTAETLRRHGPHSVNAAVHPIRGPYLLATADRVAARLAVAASAEAAC